MNKQISPNSKRLRDIRKIFHDNIHDYAKENIGNLSPEGIHAKVESEGFNPKAVFQKDVDYLGSYTRMSSPGIIKFNIVPLTYFYWWIFAELKKDGLKFNPLLLEKMVFDKTLNHELFHYFCDYISRITGSSFIHNTEEALAVACSYVTLENKYYWNSPAWWKRRFFEVAFAYTSPGYKDYVNFISRNAFYKAIVDYKGQNGSQYGYDAYPILHEHGEYAFVENLMLAIMSKPYVEYSTV